MRVLVTGVSPRNQSTLDVESVAEALEVLYEQARRTVPLNVDLEWSHKPSGPGVILTAKAGPRSTRVTPGSVLGVYFVKPVEAAA